MQLMDDVIRFIDLGRGVIFPITLESGYLTVDCHGYVEAWNSSPYHRNGCWFSDSERGIDIYTFHDEELFKDIVHTMIFDVQTLRRIVQ